MKKVYNSNYKNSFLRFFFLLLIVLEQRLINDSVVEVTQFTFHFIEAVTEEEVISLNLDEFNCNLLLVNLGDLNLDTSTLLRKFKLLVLLTLLFELIVGQLELVLN